MTGTCTRCHRTRDLARRDLCRSCYQAMWKKGNLPPAPPLPSLPTTCAHDGRHTHGTRSMYVWDACRCTPCRAANTRDQKANVHAVRHGQRALVDAGPVITHLEQLAAAGVWWRQIATTSGVSRSALSKLRNGKTTQVRRATAARLLAITTATPAAAPHALVDATTTRRRLQALVALGYSMATLGERSSVDVWRVLREALVFEATRAAVATLYTDLSNRPPQPQTRAERTSVTRSVRYATARGWALPNAWDDDTLDDPDATPCTGPEKPLTTAEQVAELLALGYDTSEILARLGRDWSQVTGAIRDPHLKAELRRRAA